MLVDYADEDGAVARSTADAPEIDGIVRINDGHHLEPGTFVDVDIDGSDDYDLSARLPH